MTETVLAPAPPVFDADVLARMGGDLGDQTFVSVFIGRFRQLLPGRVARLGTALLAEDVDDALDAALSLKVASSTVGAHELAALALAIEACVRRLDVAGARSAMVGLPAITARADAALAAYLTP